MASSDKDYPLKMSNYDEFLGKTVDECHAMMMERSGGLCRLDLYDEFDLKHLYLLHNVMNQAQCLRLRCQLSSIPHDIAFQHLFSPKRSVHVYFPALIGNNNNFVDDRFCQEAAADELLVFGGDNLLIMTEDQLMTFIRREDLSILSLHTVEGPTVEGIRNIVQVYCSFQKTSCMITMQLLPEMTSILLREIDGENISIDREVQNTERFIYKLNDRTVVVILLTDTISIES